MLLVIQIGLGIVLGSALSLVITCAIMFNPKVMEWFMNKYLDMIEKVTESLTNKEKEL